MIREIIQNLLRNALLTYGVEPENITLERPADLAHGDYATNVALAHSKTLKLTPRDLAEKLVAEISQNLPLEIKKLEVAGPGFINFFLSEDYVKGALAEALLKGESWGRSDVLKGQKVVVEYTDPNPFKEFHIGHLMTNTIGESISRLVEALGADTKRACYQGDVGLHVAHAVAYMLDQKLPWDESMLKTAYASGIQKAKESEEFKNFVIEINKKIYSREDGAVNVLYDEGRKSSLEYFDRIYKKLGTKFDYFFFESVTGPFGKEIVEKNIGTVFTPSEGAIVYKGDEEKGLHTRVFINKEGLPTYEAKELGLAKMKYETFPYDTSIVITANEVDAYFRVLLAAMNEVFPELAAKTVHISHGMMRLPTGKMSSRTGNVVTGESLLDEVKERVQEKIQDSDFSAEEKNTIAEKVALGAIKYSILRQASGKDIIFDFDQSLSFEGDSGPYLQYTYARTQSLLTKAADKSTDVYAAKEITSLHRHILYFPEVVLRAGEERQQHYIATYLIELAREFNSFYGNTIILDGADDEGYKLALVKTVSQTLKNGLNLLGIPVPERM